MTSRIRTGGLKEFVYSKEHEPKLTQEESLGIEQAYEKARIRKRKEKIVKWGVIILIILIILGYVLLR